MIGDDEMTRAMWSEGKIILFELGMPASLVGKIIGRWNRQYGPARTLAAIRHLDSARPPPADLIRFGTQFFKAEWKQVLPGGAV